MNKFSFLYIGFCLLSLLATAPAIAQDVSINILASPVSLPQSTTGSIRIDVCNTDPANTPAAVNALQPQISVGPNVTIVGVTALDGSTLTTFSVVSNSGQTIQLSNSAALPNAACFSFNVIIQGVTVDAPGSGGLITGMLGFGGAAPAGNLLVNDASTSSVNVVAPVLPDLTPIMYLRPTVVYGNATPNLVVDVYEINSVALTGTVIVRISRDATLAFSFDASATQVNARAVQNSLWSFNGSNPAYYELTSVAGVGAGSVLSFGLNGVLSGSTTEGELNVSAVVISSAAEQTLVNNSAAGRIKYFAAAP